VSGHSKWSSIKHKKGAADAKRAGSLEALARDHRRAKEGGGDPAGNLALQNAIEKSKSYSMPKDKSSRDREGLGPDADASAFETVVYEGYGRAVWPVIVEALTDNRTPPLRRAHTFAKNDANLGGSGAVAWLFERRRSSASRCEGRRRG